MTDAQFQAEIIRLSKHHGAMDCLKEVISDMHDFLKSEENLSRDELRMWNLIFELISGRFEEQSQVINEYQQVHMQENNIFFIGGKLK
ncbi:hypothetical protein [Macrococcus animalis]|uniref:hypothetical protein n=1 Tax=Macrococcus animalis TaxID=3395467 RepID=UPI0039BE8EBD